MKVKSVKVKEFFQDIPDIDVDFEPQVRDKVKEYIVNKYKHALPLYREGKC